MFNFLFAATSCLLKIFLCNLVSPIILSAIFDTFDHGMPLQHLKRCLGLNCTVLKCLFSYLNGRSLSLSFGPFKSFSLYLECHKAQLLVFYCFICIYFSLNPLFSHHIAPMLTICRLTCLFLPNKFIIRN